MSTQSSSMVRTCTALALLPTAALTIVAALAWANNLDIGKQIVADYLSGNIGSIGESRVYSGPLPVFDILAVDFTTISTAVPLIGLIFICVGLLRILCRHADRASPSFPFTARYDVQNVVHGLIGTVLGCIAAIGATKMTGSLDLLYSGMFAALWSTGVAFIWVYTVGAMIIRPLMRYCYNATSLGYSGEDPDLGDEAVGFADSLQAAGAQVTALTASVTQLAAAVPQLLDLARQVPGFASELSAEAKARADAAEALGRTATTISEAVAAMAASHQELLAALKQEREAREREFARVLAELEARAKAAETQLARFRQAIMTGLEPHA